MKKLLLTVTPEMALGLAMQFLVQIQLETEVKMQDALQDNIDTLKRVLSPDQKKDLEVTEEKLLKASRL